MIWGGFYVTQDKTMLDKSFNPTEAEARIYKMWEESGAFKPRAAKPTDTKDDNFSIVIPPPNVTGSLIWGMR